jgi:hypothetical protein
MGSHGISRRSTSASAACSSRKGKPLCRPLLLVGRTTPASRPSAPAPATSTRQNEERSPVARDDREQWLARMRRARLTERLEAFERPVTSQAMMKEALPRLLQMLAQLGHHGDTGGLASHIAEAGEERASEQRLAHALRMFIATARALGLTASELGSIIDQAIVDPKSCELTRRGVQVFGMAGTTPLAMPTRLPRW